MPVTTATIERLSIPVPECGCWIWLGHLSVKGYGRVKWAGRNVSSHRASWAVFRGPIPAGLCVLHQCDVPACVNPDHLYLGTVAQNNADKRIRGRVKGERNPFSKLTDAAVVAILASTEVAERLGEQFGVHASCISSIRHGRAWQHIPRPGTAMEI